MFVCSLKIHLISLLEKKQGENILMKDVEGILDGNICRCTGYRPIMDVFKGFAKDAPLELKAQNVDLEVCFHSFSRKDFL